VTQAMAVFKLKGDAAAKLAPPPRNKPRLQIAA
jgi:hypothetical protein